MANSVYKDYRRSLLYGIQPFLVIPIRFLEIVYIDSLVLFMLPFMTKIAMKGGISGLSPAIKLTLFAVQAPFLKSAGTNPPPPSSAK
jgi:hypothetical protein